jgi:hypothetical protein
MDTKVFHGAGNQQRVRVTDARELTAKEAVRRVLQEAYRHYPGLVWCGERSVLEQMGLRATVKNGRVIVREVRP